MGIGLLRTLFAIAVVLGHATDAASSGVKLLNGVIAVQSFYIISGFYMAMILSERYKDKLYFFYTNRILRLYPIYWVVLLLSVVLAYVFHFGPFAMYEYYHLTPFTSFFLSLSNIFMLGQDIVMFLGIDGCGELFFTSDFRTTSPMLFLFLFCCCSPIWG